MERLLLLREKNQLPDCTLGVLYRNNEAICCTLELPWLNNQQQKSCIPKGSYEVTRYFSPSKKSEVFLLHDVPFRTMVQIHSGNTINDIKGCIAVGRVYGSIKGMRAVLHSRNTMKKLLTELPEPFILDIE